MAHAIAQTIGYGSPIERQNWLPALRCLHFAASHSCGVLDSADWVIVACLDWLSHAEVVQVTVS